MKQIASIFLCVLLFLCCAGYISVPINERVYADGFNGSTYEGSATETITYSTKKDNKSFIAGGVPKYFNTTEYTNTCANVGGAIVLGYYDKEYEELIPNFQAARVIRDKILFAKQTTAVQDVIKDLYKKMDTNVTGAGTTAKDFRTGLQNYVLEKGRKISYTSVVNNEKIDFDIFKQAITEKKPIALFVSKYTMLSLGSLEKDNYSDEYNKSFYGGDHVLIAYGIREIIYYNDNGSIKDQVTLLQVATGYSQDALAYILLDERVKVIEGYKIDIY